VLGKETVFHWLMPWQLCNRQSLQYVAAIESSGGLHHRITRTIDSVNGAKSVLSPWSAYVARDPKALYYATLLVHLRSPSTVVQHIDQQNYNGFLLNVAKDVHIRFVECLSTQRQPITPVQSIRTHNILSAAGYSMDDRNTRIEYGPRHPKSFFAQGKRILFIQVPSTESQMKSGPSPIVFGRP
jgi:hypothetical protein